MSRSLTAIVAICVAGCASSSTTTHPIQNANPLWSEAQTAAMSDGVVTSKEYHDGFRRYSSCLSEGGFELVNVVDKGVRIDFALPSEAVDTGVDERCYEGEWAAVDSTWQINNDDPEVNALYERCLRENGLPIPDSQNEMVRGLLDAGISPGSCYD